MEPLLVVNDWISTCAGRRNIPACTAVPVGEVGT